MLCGRLHRLYIRGTQVFLCVCVSVILNYFLLNFLSRFHWSAFFAPRKLLFRKQFRFFFQAVRILLPQSVTHMVIPNVGSNLRTQNLLLFSGCIFVFIQKPLSPKPSIHLYVSNFNDNLWIISLNNWIEQLLNCFSPGSLW